LQGLDETEKLSEGIVLHRSIGSMSCFLGFVLLVFASVSNASLFIKKSNSGICHPPEGGWYDRTKNYKAFDFVEACLATGGRLPKGVSRSHQASIGYAEVRQEPNSGYARERFGAGWADADGDCQDSRAEALIQMSSTTVRFADSKRCRVITGRWISPFTGNVIQNASDIDIDHVVPLRWAWYHGAADWTQEKRETFANDPRNLWPVELSLNRSKGARGPEDWLPPSGRCQYIARFSRLIKIYKLSSANSGFRT
jgi:hypothetical protein